MFKLLKRKYDSALILSSEKYKLFISLNNICKFNKKGNNYEKQQEQDEGQGKEQC
jgi:hypothetical protein